MWFIVNTDKFQEQKTKEFLEETYPGIIRQVYLPKCRTKYQDVNGGERFRLKPLIYGMVFVQADNPQVLKKILSHWGYFHIESTYKKCLREEWGKFTGYQLLSSFWLKVARTDEDGNTTRWDRGTLPIRNLYSKWGMLRFGRMRKVTNWIWTLWFIVSYWWAT